LLYGSGYIREMREETQLSLENVVDRAVRSMAKALAEDWNLPSEREALLEIALGVQRRLAQIEDG
jgi:hypothetical protein